MLLSEVFPLPLWTPREEVMLCCKRRQTRPEGPPPHTDTHTHTQSEHKKHSQTVSLTHNSPGVHPEMLPGDTICVLIPTAVHSTELLPCVLIHTTVILNYDSAHT